MEKMIIEHINLQDIPAKWSKLLKDIVPSTYKITIESEPTFDQTPEPHIKKSWGEIPLFGMWKDRKDMEDPADYVKQLRKSRF